MDRMDDARLGRAVEEQRTARGLSQDMLAERMTDLGSKWSRVTVSKVERAARSLKATELPALLSVLSCSWDDLMGEGDPLHAAYLQAVEEARLEHQAVIALQGAIRNLTDQQRQAYLDYVGALNAARLVQFLRLVRDAPGTIVSAAWDRGAVTDAVKPLALDAATARKVAGELHNGLQQVEFGTDPDAETFTFEAADAG